MYGFYKLAIFDKPFYRMIGEDPVPSSATEMRLTINETIDGSVFDRWQRDIAYRPLNLSQWAARKGATIEALHGSVRADEPSVLVFS